MGRGGEWRKWNDGRTLREAFHMEECRTQTIGQISVLSMLIPLATWSREPGGRPWFMEHSFRWNGPTLKIKAADSGSHPGRLNQFLRQGQQSLHVRVPSEVLRALEAFLRELCRQLWRLMNLNHTFRQNMW
jgi:hypothetical protein